MKASLDHFVGRPVERVLLHKTNDWGWAIQLEGGTIIRNHDKRRTAPPEELVGTVLQASMLSELDTRVIFGTKDGPTTEVLLTPAQWSLADPAYGNTEEFFPQRVDEEEDMTPPDPSPDRVADGPDENFFAAEAEALEKHDAAIAMAQEEAEEEADDDE